MREEGNIVYLKFGVHAKFIVTIKKLKRRVYRLRGNIRGAWRKRGKWRLRRRYEK